LAKWTKEKTTRGKSSHSKKWSGQWVIVRYIGLAIPQDGYSPIWGCKPVPIIGEHS